MDDYQKYLKYKNKYMELKETRAKNNEQNNMSGGDRNVQRRRNDMNGGDRDDRGHRNDMEENLREDNRRQSQSRASDHKKFPLVDEIHFWGRQMMEHLLFLYLGLEDGDHQLKDKSYGLHVQWKKMLYRCFYNNGINVDYETVELSSTDLKKVTDLDKEEVLHLLDTTIQLKKLVQKGLEDGKWIGWIFLSLVKHMLKEADYFKKKLNGDKMTVEQEIHFANEHNSEEISTTAQLIDPMPSQQETIEIARAYGLKKMAQFKNGKTLVSKSGTNPFPRNWTEEDEKILQGVSQTELATLLKLSIKYANELSELADVTGKKIESNQLKSIISPVLAHHTHREYLRFAKTLKKIK